MIFSRRNILKGLAGSGAAMLWGFPTDSHAAAEDGIFGFGARTGATRVKFPKWQGAIRKYFENDLPLRAVGCGPARQDACQLVAWESFLEKLSALDVGFPKKLNAVNAEMNRRNYILDSINWGVSDYWESPAEFLVRSGDCEDYAITKYFSLRHLGVPADSMRVVVLLDRNLKVPHAVLALKTANDTLVLDNQIQQVISHTRIHHYHPYYSVNENSWQIYSRRYS